jgi:3'-phosphoadenosine 5'-phosphosulfate sulfotransferase (PAPS reductase)/FAD synthetase
VSGGKDSTLLLQLAREIDPAIPAMRADGPVALSDRAGHVARLARAAGGPWVVVPYAYDVAGVLAGDVPYPHACGAASPPGSKIRELLDAAALRRADGLALGLRASESRGRLWNAATRGTLYEAGGRWVATPLAWWTAEEVLAVLVASNRLPLNPVYERSYLLPDFEHLRDGTWMPNQTADAHGYRAWLQWHYPEHVADYDRALVVLRGGR